MYRGGSETVVPCNFCGRPRASGAGICPHCAGGGIARIELSEQTAAKLKAERTGIFRPWPRWLRAAVFVLAFPVVVPSLVVHWVFAKRWGRVPYLSVFVDGAVVLLICMHYPLLMLFGILSFASALVLLFRAARQGHASSGIFLGYSNLTVMPLILGGIATVVGLLGGLPSSLYRSASLATVEVTDFDLRDALEEHIMTPKRVRFRDGTVDWNSRVSLQDGLRAMEPGKPPSFAPIVPLASGRSGSSTARSRIWIATRNEVAPPRAEGLLVRAPSPLATKLVSERGDEGKNEEDAFVVIADAPLYEAFGVIDSSDGVSWGYLAIGALGIALLAFATFRAVQEEDELAI